METNCPASPQLVPENRCAIAAHYGTQLQIGRYESQIERLEKLAQRMANELALFEAVFEKENKKFEPPLPLETLKALLADWRVYVTTRG